MSKIQKKKVPVAEGETYVEIITKVEYIYEYTKATTGVEPEYKWGEIYRMIANQNVPDVEGLKNWIYMQTSRNMLLWRWPQDLSCSHAQKWLVGFCQGKM